MRRCLTVLSIVCAIFSASLALQAAEFHVKQDGSGDFTVIRDAIDVSVDGDTIVVHPGTYYENVRYGGKNIIVRSTDPENWDVVEATVIDGGQNGPVVAFAGTEDESCVLSGFTITNGRNGYGAGISGAPKPNAPHTKATIENCIITGNTAADAVGASGGGLMWCDGRIEGCTVRYNSAGWGGGLSECRGGLLENCRIIGNTAERKGGGLFKFEGVITGCTISDNSASDGDGGALCQCKAEIETCTIVRNSVMYGNGAGVSDCAGALGNCVISDNSRGLYGGGIYGWEGNITNWRIAGNTAQFGGGLAECDGDITNCVMAGNSADPFGSGGGLYHCMGDIKWCDINGNSSFYEGGGLLECPGNISHCIIRGNHSSMCGGGVGVFNLDYAGGTITDCVISENSADSSGGGVYDYHGDIKNCLIVGNSAVSWYGGGGAGLNYCTGLIQNCTIVNNQAAEEGGGIYNCDSVRNCIIWGNSGTSEIGPAGGTAPSYSCMKDEDWAGAGVGNISDDPLFATGPLGDYYLSCKGAGQASDSPCMEAGSNTAKNLGLDKLTTRTDGGFDKGTVDMGYHHPVLDLRLETSLNAEAFVPGDRIEAFLTLENNGSELLADVYVALILPDRTVVCFGPDGFSVGVFPFAASVSFAPDFHIGPLRLFELTVPPDVTPGGYAYAAALSLARGETFISTSVTSFTIRSK